MPDSSLEATPQPSQTNQHEHATRLIAVFGNECGPSQIASKAIEMVRHDLQHQMTVETLDISSFTDRFDISLKATPTLILMHNDQEIARHEGTLLPTQLSRWVRSGLKKR